MRLFGRSPKTDEATNEALTRTRKSFFGRIGSLFGGGDITEELWESLEEVLIGADAGVSTTMDVLDRVRARKPRDSEQVRSMLRDELVAILDGAAAGLVGGGIPRRALPGAGVLVVVRQQVVG